MNKEKLIDMHYNLFFMYSDQYIEKQYLKFLSDKIKIIKEVLFYFIRPFGHLYRFFLNPSILNNKNKNNVFFVCHTQNNYFSIKGILDHLNNNYSIVKTDYSLDFDGQYIPKFIPGFLSFIFIPKYFQILFKSNKKEKKILLFSFDTILYSMGYHYYFNWYIKNYKPKTIIYSNDHIFQTRAIVRCAEKYSIKCIYLQHASVTNIFPPLISSFSLLEGEDAKNKYLENESGSSGIHLIGMPKFDKYVNKTNSYQMVKSIGICTTYAMKKNTVIKLLEFIVNNFPNIKLYLRPHPAEISKYVNYDNIQNVTISNSIMENSFKFLNKVDAIITGNSSILLEAALVNVYPIYYFSEPRTKWKDDLYDKYGYIKNKIAIEIKNENQLFDYLNLITNQNPNISINTKYYCDTVGTKWQGRSSELASKYINQFISN